MSSPGAARLTHGPHTLNADGSPLLLIDATDSTSLLYQGGEAITLTVSSFWLSFCSLQPVPSAPMLPAAVTITTFFLFTAQSMAAWSFRSPALGALGESHE